MLSPFSQRIDREALEREVTSCGYGILRAMEEVAVVVLEQLVSAEFLSPIRASPPECLQHLTL